jgi:hypothetical protein
VGRPGATALPGAVRRGRRSHLCRGVVAAQVSIWDPRPAGRGPDQGGGDPRVRGIAV